MKNYWIQALCMCAIFSSSLLACDYRKRGIDFRFLVLKNPKQSVQKRYKKQRYEFLQSIQKHLEHLYTRYQNENIISAAQRSHFKLIQAVREDYALTCQYEEELRLFEPFIHDNHSRIINFLMRRKLNRHSCVLRQLLRPLTRLFNQPVPHSDCR
jgi:hypothetical protein